MQIALIEVLWEHIGHLAAKAIIFMSMDVFWVLVTLPALDTGQASNSPSTEVL